VSAVLPPAPDAAVADGDSGAPRLRGRWLRKNPTLIDDIDSFQAPISTTLAVKLAGVLRLTV